MNFQGISPRLSLDSVIVATPGQVSVDLGAETVILDVDSGIYYGLNDTGKSVWNLLQKPVRVVNICESLFEKYDVEFDTCVQAVLGLLEQLITHGLVDLQYEPVT